MSNLKFAVPAFVLALGFVVGSTSTTYAKPADATKTKQKCAFCHTDVKKPKELTDGGKYYKEHNNSLEGYKAAK